MEIAQVKDDPTITERLAEIEQEHSVKFTFDWDNNSVEAEGLEDAIAAALTELQPRAEFIAAIKARTPQPKKPRVRMRIAADVPPSLAVQRQNYVRWFKQKPQLYWRSEVELDRMFALCQEGDLILPDFAFSFTVQKPDGRLLSVNRQGRFEDVSPYSPHRAKVIEDEEN
jgi:hypothetical protein